MSGRTVWLAKDAAWWRREWIVELGEEFGPVGPAVIDWLECEAKAQNTNGWLKAGVRSLARGVFADKVTVSDVLSRAVTLGVLCDYEDAAGIFKCRLSWWEADQEKGLHASRQAAYRSRKQGESAEEVTLSDVGTYQNVTGDENRTGQDITDKTTSLSAAPTRSVRSVFEAWVSSTGRSDRTVLDSKRQRIIRNALKSFPVADLIDAVDGWRFSSHHRGENERRTVYNDLGLLLRDAEHIEKFRDLARGAPTSAPTPHKGSGRFAHLDTAAGR